MRETPPYVYIHLGHPKGYEHYDLFVVRNEGEHYCCSLFIGSMCYVSIFRLFSVSIFSLCFVCIFSLCSVYIFSLCYVSIFGMCYVRFLVCVM